MEVVSTVFEEACVWVHGVSSCTTFVGSRHGGAVANTPPATPTPTHITPASTSTSTHVSPTSSPTPKPASPSPTQSLPSSTPSQIPTAATPSDPSGSDSSTLSSSRTSSSTPTIPSQDIASSTTIAITSAPSSATATSEPDSLDTNTSVENSPSVATPTTSSSSSFSTSFSPLPPSDASSKSHLSAGAIAGIAIGAAAVLLVLLTGCIWYAAKRRRSSPTVVVSSTAAGSDASILSRTTSTTRARSTLRPVENEHEKLECSLRNSLETLVASIHSDGSVGSMVVEGSNFEPLDRGHSPLPPFLETVPFLATTSVLAKGARGAANTDTATDTALSPSSTEAIAVARQSTVTEMGGGAQTRRHCELWNGDAAEDGEEGEGTCWTFRYETDAGIRLDGGPAGELGYADDDQRTIATVVTLPPPYSRY